MPPPAHPGSQGRHGRTPQAAAPPLRNAAGAQKCTVQIARIGVKGAHRRCREDEHGRGAVAVHGILQVRRPPSVNLHPLCTTVSCKASSQASIHLAKKQKSAFLTLVHLLSFPVSGSHSVSCRRRCVLVSTGRARGARARGREGSVRAEACGHRPGGVLAQLRAAIAPADNHCPASPPPSHPPLPDLDRAVRSAAQAVRPRATQAVRQMGSSEEHAAGECPRLPVSANPAVPSRGRGSGRTQRERPRMACGCSAQDVAPLSCVVYCRQRPSPEAVLQRCSTVRGCRVACGG